MRDSRPGARRRGFAIDRSVFLLAVALLTLAARGVASLASVIAAAVVLVYLGVRLTVDLARERRR